MCGVRGENGTIFNNILVSFFILNVVIGEKEQC